MKRKVASLPLLLVLLAIGTTGAPTTEQQIVFTDITVIDATGGPAKPHMMVMVSRDKITGIQRYNRNRVSKTAQVVNGQGKFLIPGLWDMHVHWYDERYLPLFIANGVTGVRQMWGMEVHQQWRQRIKDGSLVGPRQSIASPILDGPIPIWPGSVAVADATEAREAVRSSRKDGADFIKVYNLLPRDAYFAIAEETKKEGIPFAGHVPYAVRLTEASDAGQKSVEHLSGFLLAASSQEEQIQMQLVGAMSSSEPYTEASAVLRRQSKELRDTFDPRKAAAIEVRLARNRTWQAPTLTVLRAMANLDDPEFTSDARLKYMPHSIRAQWNPQNDFRLKQRTADDWLEAKRTYELYERIVGDIRRSGVPLLAGTDTGNPFCFPGFSLHDELALLVTAGLSPMEALQAATRSAANYLGMLDSYGTVERGKTADLLVLDANPLDDIRNTRRIAGVMICGRFFSKPALDKMLADVEALASLKSIGEPLLKTISEKGADAAVEQYRRLKREQAASYEFGEDELIGLGYQLLSMKEGRGSDRDVQAGSRYLSTILECIRQSGRRIPGWR
jgi:imidazolonepropionase-like amidohydrolase